MSRAPRILTGSGACLIASLLAAPAALAADGEGIYGRTDDRVITFFSFGVIAFFVLFVVGMTIIQSRLDSRKERVREDIERLRKP